MPTITICPTCGSDQINSVTRDLMRRRNGVSYTVPSVTFHECSACGEHLYDRQAMQKIESHRPSHDSTLKRKSA